MFDPEVARRHPGEQRLGERPVLGRQRDSRSTKTIDGDDEATRRRPAGGQPARQRVAELAARQTSSSRNPARGSAGMSQIMFVHPAQPLIIRDVVGVGVLASAHDGHDDPEADHDLGRRHHQHEEHDRLPADVVRASWRS